MDTKAAQLNLLMELEVKHDKLIVQLDELDKRVQKALAECQSHHLDSVEGGRNPRVG